MTKLLIRLKQVVPVLCASLLLAIQCFAPASAEIILPPEVSFFEETFGDMPEELATMADEDKKALLIMFETDDCPWCMRMKQTVLNRQRVQEYYKSHFRIISLNAEGGAPIVNFDGQDTSETKFALELLRVRATPVFAFFDANGKLLTKYTGTTKNADDFLLLGEFVVGDFYKHSRFSKYRREQLSKKAS
jgi:thioredoxin-related protein